MEDWLHFTEPIPAIRHHATPENAVAVRNWLWLVAALVSWAIALFEYLLQVPANRIGFGELSLAQLKVMQEVITLAVFVPFAVFYMGQAVKMNYLYAGVCLLGAVYFIFKA